MLDMMFERLDEYAVILTDVNGDMQWLSVGAEKILGITLSDGVSRNLEELFTSEDRDKGIPGLEMDLALSRGWSLDDRWHERSDGSRFWAAGALVALRNDGERGELLGFGKIIRNRTDVKEQVVELQNRVQALSSAGDQMRKSLLTVAHELRNPLGPLASAIELVSEKGAKDGADWLLKPTATMQRQLATMTRLVNDLIDVNRLGAGKLSFEKQRVHIDLVLRHSVEAVQSDASAKGQQLSLLLPKNCVDVEGDPIRLQQIFTNLLNNAVKFTPENGRIWISGTQEGNEAVIHVEDTGIGIPPEKQSAVFDLFTQVRERDSSGGLGIGLALVKQLVRLHEGSVQLKSDGLGKGSLFTVRLPLAR